MRRRASVQSDRIRSATAHQQRDVAEAMHFDRASLALVYFGCVWEVWVGGVVRFRLT